MAQELQPFIEVKPVTVSAPAAAPPGNGFLVRGTPSLTQTFHPALAVDFGPVVPPLNLAVRHALHHAPGLINAFGLKCKQVAAITVPVPEVCGMTSPDLSFNMGISSNRRLQQWMREVEGYLALRIGNLEVVDKVRSVRDGDVLVSNEMVLRNLLGRMIELPQVVLVTGRGPAHDRPRDVVTGHGVDHETRDAVLIKVRCVYLDECRVRTVPLAVRRTPFGAAAVLHFADGGTDWQMANALQQWYAHGMHLQPGSPLFWQSTLDLTPSLRPIYWRQLATMQKGKRMANRKQGPKVEESATLRTVLDAQLGFIADVAELPRVAHRIQAARDEGYAQGRREAQIHGLLAVLESRSIRLTKKQRKQLAGLRYEQLPTFETAMLAEDAADFEAMGCG